jgi:hypothetical protein
MWGLGQRSKLCTRTHWKRSSRTLALWTIPTGPLGGAWGSGWGSRVFQVHASEAVPLGVTGEVAHGREGLFLQRQRIHLISAEVLIECPRRVTQITVRCQGEVQHSLGRKVAVGLFLPGSPGRGGLLPSHAGVGGRTNALQFGAFLKTEVCFLDTDWHYRMCPQN